MEQEQDWEQEAESFTNQRDNSSTNGGKKSRKKKSGTERALEEYYSTKEDDGTDTRTQDKEKEATENKGKESTAKKGTKSSTSQMGVSVKQVLSRGKQPNCQYCRHDIARGEWHTVNICENQSNCGNTKSGSDKFTITCVVFIC